MLGATTRSHRPRWLQEFYDPLLNSPWPGYLLADFFILHYEVQSRQAI